jgi:hypothetical protein
MDSQSSDTGFIVWGIDQTPYGPVELPALVSWVKDERVTADTWVYATQEQSWQKAASVPELKLFFDRKTGGSSSTQNGALDPRTLRRMKVLACFTDPQLERFAKIVEVIRIPQWAVIVQQGEPGDAMFLILDGELRVRLNVMGKETILATLGTGEFFGDIAIFDQGPRSADVVANMESTLGKITVENFNQLAQEAPELATPFLIAVGKTLTARIRADNKRFGDSVKFARSTI